MQSGIQGLATKESGLNKIEVNITSYDSEIGEDPGNPNNRSSEIFAKLASPEYQLLSKSEQQQIYQEARDVVNQHKRELEQQLTAALLGQLDDKFSGNLIRIDDTMGVYEGIIEPSYRIQIDISGVQSEADLDVITDVLLSFAEKHNQKEFHVSKVFSELPKDKKEGEYDPMTGTTFVRNIEFTMDPDIQNDSVLVDKLVSLVNNFAKRPENNLLGYTVVHPEGFTFYMNPDPDAISTEEYRTIFTETILKLNNEMNKYLQEIGFTNSEPIKFDQTVRMIKTFKRDNQSKTDSSYTAPTQPTSQ